ncbi:MAG TPA: antibiotic biosynthesis monooxygenase [Clostridia bacterium]|nr:antibiotic biosynthesis monooxygenase [Clostridia bacterium]
MFYVIFEVVVNQEHMDEYLSLAAGLRESLMKNKGFIRAERFSSIVDNRKLLSLSVWESEEAISDWRNRAEHRLGQRQGRDSFFESYTITVTSPVRTYTDTDREEAPKDSNEAFGSETYK